MERSKKSTRLVLGPSRLLFFLMLSLFLNLSCVPNPEDITLSDNSDVQNSSPPSHSSYYIEEIMALTHNSKCSAYSWQDRGRAPAAYIQGMALTFARSFCRLKTSQAAFISIATVLSNNTGDAKIDALTYYSSLFSQSGMSLTNNRDETVRSLYTLGIGLGMRESSGKYCEGRDMSASNTSASTAEAGIFQTSYNSLSASEELSKLYNEYKLAPHKCLLEVFSSNIKCKTSSIAGTGPGADYQAFNKSCPAFATEYAMIMLRVRRNHYGPINRKEAQVVQSCNQMLNSVQDYIENDLNACDDLNL
ncbi:MAG: hypothetical protein HOP07_07990 [Bacteriovoracaceae bacterium]|nr:hypothetical protein [Bacteriovoracaceae bacterium]